MTFRTIDQKPIFWRDKADVVHSCEGADVHPRVRLLWTLCERDVPANAAYISREEAATCPRCKAVS